MTESVVPNVLSIGKLLCDCDVLRRDSLGATMAAAANDDITVGQYLIQNKLVEGRVVRAAIMAHALLYKRLVTYQLVIDALKAVVNEGITIEQALDKLNWNHIYYDTINKLKRLLGESVLVKQADLELAYDMALADKQPLITVLMKRGQISDLVGEKVLVVHEKVMQGECSLEEGIKMLEKTKIQSGYLITEKRDVADSKLKLSEILIGAELVTPDELIAAIEKGHAENVPFGKILVRDYGLPEGTLVQAEFIQTLINKNFVTIYDGIQRLLSLTKNSSITGKDSDF